MKMTIYYFTGTGNSLAVARDLAAEYEGAELLPVARLIHQESIVLDADIVGIVYPAWLHHVPPIIEEFINKAVIKSTYIFAVCCYYKSPYNSLFNLNSILEKKGSKLDAGFAIAMGGKYVILKDLVSPKESVYQRYTEEKTKVKAIAQIIKDKCSVGIEGEYDKQDKEYSKQLIDTHKNVYKVYDKFWVTQDCDLCGLCVELCPRENLKLLGGRLTWGENCDNCLACLHWCPKYAVQNGKLTQKSGRHHHPDITANDIINQKKA